MTDIDLPPDPSLERQFRLLDDVQPDDVWPLVTSHFVRVREQPRHRRTSLVGVAAGVVLLGGVVTFLVIRSPTGTTSVIDTVVEQTSSPPISSSSTAIEPTDTAILEGIPEPPLQERTAEAVAAVDNQVLVWGGGVPNHLDGSEPPYSDGALFDRATRTWRAVAQSPLPGGSASALALDQALIVLNADRVAAYEPAADTWIELSPPATDGLAQLVRAGDEVVVLPAAVAWNGRSWRQLAAPARFDPTWRAVADGDSIVTWGPTPGSTSGEAWRYDPTLDRWEQLPGSPLTQVYEGSAAVIVGRDLVVASWADGAAAAMNLDTLTWRSLPSVPLRAVKCWVGAARLDDSSAVLSWCGDYAVLETTDDTWTTLRSPNEAGGWTLTDLTPLGEDLILNGSSIASNSFWSDPEAIGPVPVGAATVSRERVLAVTLSGGILGQVIADLDSGCTLATVENAAPGRQTLPDAIAQQPDATTVEFWDELFGGYRLTCPDAESLRAASTDIRTPFD